MEDDKVGMGESDGPPLADGDAERLCEVADDAEGGELTEDAGDADGVCEGACDAVATEVADPTTDALTQTVDTTVALSVCGADCVGDVSDDAEVVTVLTSEGDCAAVIEGVALPDRVAWPLRVAGAVPE